MSGVGLGLALWPLLASPHHSEGTQGVSVGRTLSGLPCSSIKMRSIQSAFWDDVICRVHAACQWQTPKAQRCNHISEEGTRTLPPGRFVARRTFSRTSPGLTVAIDLGRDRLSRRKHEKEHAKRHGVLLSG